MNQVQPIEEEKRTDILKIIAIVAMLIDHVGYLLLPELTILRVIGRIAFPIFAYHVVIGYKKTSDLKKYVYRLSIFAIISQLPFAFFGGGLNIFFTLLMGILAIYLFDKNKRNLLLILFISIIAFEYFLISFDYGLYGVMIILLFFIYFNDSRSLSLSFSLLTLLYCIEANNYVQLFAIFAIPLFYLKYTTEVRLNKYFFYSFYPAHIALLLLINMIIH